MYRSNWSKLFCSSPVWESKWTYVVVWILTFLKLCVVLQVECTSLVNPVLIEHGENADKILTRLGLKGALVEDVGELPEEKTFFGEDDQGTPIVLGSWFQYASYTLAVCMFGTAFLVACIATAIYYVLFVVNDDTLKARRR